MKRYGAILFVAVLGLAACGSSGLRVYPLAKALAVRLERAGLCRDPHLNRHRRREVLCAPRPGGGRTGVATFASHRSALRSIELERDRARFIGCDEHASHGAMTFVIGPHFVVVGSDRPAAVARVMHAHVVGPPATCDRPDVSSQ